MVSNEILYEKIGQVGVITINRPQKRNAITMTHAARWIDIIDDAREDDTVKVLVVTGKETSFCAGAEFSPEVIEGEMTGFPYPLTKHSRYWEKNAHQFSRTVASFHKPYICALNGAATGWGMDLASMCDVRIASDEARVAMTYVNLGLASGGGGCYYLPKIIGVQKALDLMWTGRWMYADEMLTTGYVLKVVPHESLMEKTMAYAERLASGPAVAHQFAKKLVYQSYDLNLDQHLEMTGLVKLFNWTTNDVGEGIAAFIEKRRPSFTGS